MSGRQGKVLPRHAALPQPLNHRPLHPARKEPRGHLRWPLSSPELSHPPKGRPLRKELHTIPLVLTSWPGSLVNTRIREGLRQREEKRDTATLQLGVRTPVGHPATDRTQATRPARDSARSRWAGPGNARQPRVAKPGPSPSPRLPCAPRTEVSQGRGMKPVFAARVRHARHCAQGFASMVSFTPVILTL